MNSNEKDSYLKDKPAAHIKLMSYKYCPNKSEFIQLPVENKNFKNLKIFSIVNWKIVSMLTSCCYGIFHPSNTL